MTKDIAIIGMACRVPGAAGLEEFWRLVAEGREGVRDLKVEELAAAGVPPSRYLDPAYVKRAGTLDRPYGFDAGFFGMAPREAQLTDPQQRILLECAWHALEHAGVAPGPQPRVGVYAGVGHNYYFNRVLAADPELRMGEDGFQALLGADKDYAAARVAFKLDLRGPAVTVQTACSTSGVAIHLACQALRAGECDVALAGSARVNVPDVAGYLHVEGGPQSADGRVRPFAANATGMVLAPGVVCIVLKPLTRALSDGDRVYAVIKGSALNNDGADKIAFTAPSERGQLEVLRAALADAGIEPASVGYIEAHGTGTVLGDPIEVAALAQAYAGATRVALGSVKANIGHLDTAAGLAGVVKAALALHHRQLPPAIHCQDPNPDCEFERTPFVLPRALEEWEGPAPRRAGVSSFGFGGTNFHGLLEEAPPQETSQPRRSWQLLRLSARSPGALAAQAGSLASHLEQNDESLADVAWTLESGRARLSERVALVARDRAGAVRALRSGATAARPAARPSLVFLFPGQGAQHPGMARELFLHERVFRDTLQECTRLLQPMLGCDLERLLYPDDSSREESARALRETGLAQPAIFAVSYALARQWLAWGLKPDVMVGHSVGEFVAATLAGVFEPEHALEIVAGRAKLMQEQPGGRMLAVRLSERDALRWIEGDLAVAAINAPGLVVISGPSAQIEELDARLRDESIATIPLHTSHAFHSPMMEPAIGAFTALVERYPRRRSHAAIVSTLTGKPVTDEMLAAGYWAQQLRHTVRFGPAVGHLLETPGRVFLEVGPGANLTAAVRQGLDGHEAVAIASLPHAGQAQADALEHLLGAAGSLWCAGVELSPGALHAGERRLKAGLPGYPFAREEHFYRGTEAAPVVAASTAERPAGDPRARVRELMSRLTGRDLSGAPLDQTFLELGLDSLVLTQLATRLKSEFRPGIRFRDLFEKLDTPGKLIAHLEGAAPRGEETARASTGTPPPGARLGRDASGRPGWFVPDRENPGRYVQVQP